MADYDYIDETDNQYFGTDLPANALNRIHKVQRTVNFETACAALKSGVDFVQNDVLKLIDVPAYTWVFMVCCRVVTISDTADDLDIGTGTDANSGAVDGFIDGFDCTAAIGATESSLASHSDSIASAGGFLCTVADTIDLKFAGSNAVDDGVFEITALLIDVS